MSEPEPPSDNGASPDGQAEPLRLGGMALPNGLLIHGPTSWAVAARAGDGTLDVASGSKPNLARGRLGKIPLLRGALRLAEAFAVIPMARLGLPSSRLPFEDRAVAGSMLASSAANAAIRKLGGPNVRRELAISLVGALPALTALRNRDLAAYHGVEHKTIAAYERGLEPTEVPKEHQRCGSNLIVPMLAFSVAGQMLIERMASSPGPLVRAGVALAGVGGAVEVFVYADRRPDSAVGRAVHATGHEIQRRVSTREPNAAQLQVGVAALDELLKTERLSGDSV